MTDEQYAMVTTIQRIASKRKNELLAVDCMREPIGDGIQRMARIAALDEIENLLTQITSAL